MAAFAKSWRREFPVGVRWLTARSRLGRAALSAELAALSAELKDALGGGDGRSAAGGGTRAKMKARRKLSTTGHWALCMTPPLLVPSARGVTGLTRDGEVCCCAVCGSGQK
jgi:hypothetical protein